MVVLFSSCGFFSSRKRELVKEQIPSDRTTKKSCAIARPTSSERFVSSAIAFGTISELERTLKFLLFIIARRRERAKRAFFLYLPREIARRKRRLFFSSSFFSLKLWFRVSRCMRRRRRRIWKEEESKEEHLHYISTPPPATPARKNWRWTSRRPFGASSSRAPHTPPHTKKKKTKNTL